MKSLAPILLLLLACAEPPEKMEPERRVSGLSNCGSTLSREGKALWLTVSQGMSGELYRIDLNSKEEDLKPLRSDLTSDVVLKNKDDQHIFALTRYRLDSLQVFDTNGQVVEDLKLTENSNPSDVIEDDLGRIWLSFHNANEVKLFDSQLNELKSFNLDIMADSDKFAEINDLEYFNGQVYVLAQNLNRAKGWTPEEQSSLARIDATSLKLSKIFILPVRNPMLSKFDKRNSRLNIISAGSLDGAKKGPRYQGQYLGLQIGQGDFSKNTKSLTRNDHGFILASAINDKGSLAAIKWNKQENNNSLILDGKTILTRSGGYTLTHLARHKNCLFVSEKSNNEDYLLLVNEKGEVLSSTRLSGQVNSMLVGP